METPIATLRTPDMACLVCGNFPEGHRTVDCHPDDEALRFRLEIPLCQIHKNVTDQELVERFQASYQADQARQEAHVQEYVQALLQAPCLICEGQARTIEKIHMGAKPGLMDGEIEPVIMFAPLCDACRDAPPATVISAMQFAHQEQQARAGGAQ